MDFFLFVCPKLYLAHLMHVNLQQTIKILTDEFNC